MDNQVLLLCLVFCVVLVEAKDCDINRTENETFKESFSVEALLPHKRVIRSKFFDSPPPGAKVYRRPSYGFPPRSIISYTPPPNYKMDDDDTPYPQPPRGFTRKPEGLGDEDINNIVKYLSKQDLDKIISFAGSRETDIAYKKVVKNDRDGVYEFQKQLVQNDGTFSLNGPFVKANHDRERPFQAEYDNPNSNSIQDITKYVNTIQSINVPASPDPTPNYQQLYNDLLKSYQNPSIPLDRQNSLLSYQTAYQNYAPKSYQGSNSQLDGQESAQSYQSVQLDNAKEQLNEEQLPRPINLREDIDEAIEAAQTKQVASVARPDQSYKVEGFGDLPVMNYHSKMFSVSSYNVPHYTITSNPKPTYGPAGLSPLVEPAPPASEAREQSDAHLKAIKIWSHRSKGQAYTLHSDGSLSLERPLRPKYGPPYGH